MSDTMSESDISDESDVLADNGFEMRACRVNGGDCLNFAVTTTIHDTSFFGFNHDDDQKEFESSSFSDDEKRLTKFMMVAYHDLSDIGKVDRIEVIDKRKNEDMRLVMYFGEDGEDGDFIILDIIKCDNNNNSYILIDDEDESRSVLGIIYVEPQRT